MWQQTLEWVLKLPIKFSFSCFAILRAPEYCDDFYFFRNKIFSDSNFLALDPLIEVKKLLVKMEFDLTRIHFGTEDRRNKYPSPGCFYVRIPSRHT